MNLINEKYDIYGKPKGYIVDNIQKGDTVEYTDSKSGWKTVRVKLVGIWDGEKVQFNDGDKTLVRTKHWLKLIKK